jgi:hypothetical protein
MPTNNTLLMMGLGVAALLWLNRGGSEEDQADQLAGAAMMAAGEGTAPDAPFQAYSAPANPVFFFNQGGQMAKVPGSNVPLGASSDEDIGIYPGGQNRPELEFKVARGPIPAGTSDISPTTPEFAGPGAGNVTPASIWDDPAQSAAANFMPMLAIQDTGGGGIEIIGANVDIATLSSKETFRAENLETGFGFHTTADVLQEYVSGFTGSTPSSGGPTAVISQTVPVNAPAIRPQPDWAIDQWWDEG